MGRPLIDITGQTFGRLTVIRWISKPIFSWVCRCACGKEVLVLGGNLRSGRQSSCGCLQKEFPNSRKHGESRMNITAEYRSWSALSNRCSNPNNAAYKWYGAIGVKVCRRWRGKNGFINFLSDMGRKPSPKHSIDRYPNPYGNYEPSNCRWATAKQQRANQRSFECHSQTPAMN